MNKIDALGLLYQKITGRKWKKKPRTVAAAILQIQNDYTPNKDFVLSDYVTKEELSKIIDGVDATQGVGIENISKSETNGLIDTYKIRFTDGTTTTFQVKNGEPGKNGETGEKGKDGTNGITPHIGTNGNWWIGDIDTGEKATADPLDYADKKYGISDTPVGHVISHIGTVAPAHYLICDGKEYNIVDYPYLTQHFIDNFGSVNYFGGDGETTFAVPDLRGEFLRGTGTNSHVCNLNGVTWNEGSGSAVGVHQGATMQPITISIKDEHSTYGWVGAPSGEINTYHSEKDNSQYLNYDTGIGSSSGMYFGNGLDESQQFKELNTVGTARPTNTSVLYCIKYEPTYFIQVNQSAETKALKDEIDTLNSINFGEVINIATTTGTTHIFENNGYLQVFADYSANSSICISLNGIEIRVTTCNTGAQSGTSQCVYVKKGMRINVVSSNGICFVKFFPLI